MLDFDLLTSVLYEINILTAINLIMVRYRFRDCYTIEIITNYVCLELDGRRMCVSKCLSFNSAGWTGCDGTNAVDVYAVTQCGGMKHPCNATILIQLTP